MCELNAAWPFHCNNVIVRDSVSVGCHLRFGPQSNVTGASCTAPLQLLNALFNVCRVITSDHQVLTLIKLYANAVTRIVAIALCRRQPSPKTTPHSPPLYISLHSLTSCVIQDRRIKKKTLAFETNVCILALDRIRVGIHHVEVEFLRLTLYTSTITYNQF